MATSQLQQARRGRTNAPSAAQLHPGLRGTSPRPRMYPHQVPSAGGGGLRQMVEGKGTPANSNQEEPSIGLGLSGIEEMVSGERQMQRQQEETAPPPPPHRTPPTTATTAIYRPVDRTAASGSSNTRAQAGASMAAPPAVNNWNPSITELGLLLRHAPGYIGGSDDQSKRERQWAARDKYLGRWPETTREKVLVAYMKEEFARLDRQRDWEEWRARQRSPETEAAESSESGDGLVSWPQRRGSSSVQTVYHIDDELPASARR